MPEDGQNGSDSWPLKASGGSRCSTGDERSEGSEQGLPGLWVRAGEVGRSEGAGHTKSKWQGHSRQRQPWLCGEAGSEAGRGSREMRQERSSWGHPEDLWASSRSFSFLICGNGNEDLSHGGLGPGLRAIRYVRSSVSV